MCRFVYVIISVVCGKPDMGGNKTSLSSLISAPGIERPGTREEIKSSKKQVDLRE